MDVTVYTLPRCGGCKATKRFLTQRGIPFTEINLADYPDKAEALKTTRGFTQAPIVEVEGWDAWSGFRSDYLITLAAEVKRGESHSNDT